MAAAASRPTYSPGALSALVNACSGRRVASSDLLQDHARRWGGGVAVGGRIDLVAWCAALVRARVNGTPVGSADALRRAEQEKPHARNQADYQREYRRRNSGLDISIPAAADPERRAQCSRSLVLFAITYFRPLLYLALADMHREIASDFEHRALYGGRTAVAAPRGSGKSIWCLIGIVWAILYGHRRYVIYACENHSLADERLAIIKAWLEHGVMGDTTLLSDFPEVCAPIAALEGRSQRAASMTVNGEPVNMRWTADVIVFPTVAGSACSGARIATTGLSAGVRGSLDAEGRPDYVVIDDPMGDEAAASAAIIRKRRKNINKGMAWLGGQGKTIAMNMLCTIIERNDIGDQYTDRSQSPAWNGRRYQYLKGFNTDTPELAKEYIRLRREKSEDDPDARTAHRFFLDHAADFAAMWEPTLPDAYAGRHVLENGAPCNLLPDGSEVESSAVEHALNVIADDGMDTFLSEFQNAPVDEYEGAIVPLTVAEVLARENGLPRGVVPHGLTTLVAQFDCGTRTDIHFAVCAFGAGFTGAVIDYGVFPVDESAPADAAVLAGLTAACADVLHRAYAPERGGNDLSVSLALIDSGFETNTVYDFCNRNPQKHITFPSKGEGSDNFAIPKRKGITHGAGWWYGEARDSRQMVYHVHANWWKSFVDARLRVGLGGAGALSINTRPLGNQSLAESLTSEAPRPAFLKKTGDQYNAWALKVGRTDNHLYDCVVGCHMAAGRMGVTANGPAEKPRKKKGWFARVKHARSGY